jgi:hypothetical protein
MQNLRQKGMTVKEYTEEFYRIKIREGHRESDDEKVARYMNGMRYEIQDEMSMVTIRNMEDAYHIALKDEEKLAQKQSQRGRGKSQSRGNQFPKTEYRSLRRKKRNLILTQKEEEVHREDNDINTFP